MKRTYSHLAIEHLSSLAGDIIALLPTHPPYAVVVLDGAMGAGKTTLTRIVMETLGVIEIVNSPTFAIVNEYDSRIGKIFHFDFYRIEDTQELEEMGFEEIWGKQGNCFVEWFEKVENFYSIPYPIIRLRIETEDPDHRRIELTVPERMGEISQGL